MAVLRRRHVIVQGGKIVKGDDDVGLPRRQWYMPRRTGGQAA
jgi:hypothetical protein